MRPKVHLQSTLHLHRFQRVRGILLASPRFAIAMLIHSEDGSSQDKESVGDGSKSIHVR